MHCSQWHKYNSFWILKGFNERVYLRIILHSAFHFRVRKIITKLILHTILDVCPGVGFMNNFLYIFRNLLCDVTHHMSYGSVSTSVNEVTYCIAFKILYGILCFVDL